MRWEEKAIIAAAQRREVDLSTVDVKSQAFDVNIHRQDVFGDVVLQRCVGYFRSVHTTALLEAMGLRVVNDLQSALVTGNKLLTTLALLKAGVPMPKTCIAFTTEAALQAVERLGYPAILKPTIGSWGKHVAPLKDRASAQAIFEDRESMFPLYQVYYIQQQVQRPPRDIRSFVIGDEVVAAIYRVSAACEWRTNTARGGKAVPCPITGELEELSLKAVRPFGPGIYGVDLMESPDGLVVHEVNNTTEFRNTVPATGVDIPGLIVAFLLKLAKSSA